MERITPTGYQLIAKDERYGFEVWGSLKGELSQKELGREQGGGKWEASKTDWKKEQVQTE